VAAIFPPVYSYYRNANALTVTNCTIEKKRTLFSIAEAALSVRTRADVIPTSNFQLLQSYLGESTSTSTQLTFQTNGKRTRKV